MNKKENIVIAFLLIFIVSCAANNKTTSNTSGKNQLKSDQEVTTVKNLPEKSIVKDQDKRVNKKVVKEK